MSRRLVAGLLVLSSCLALSASPTQATGSSQTVVAVGDIAWNNPALSLANEGYNRTGALANNLQPDFSIFMGDLAYPKGSNSDFALLNNSNWAPLLPDAIAVPGNHEWRTASAAGYYKWVRDFQAPYKAKGKYWWSVRKGTWTVIGLDSEKMSGALGTEQLSFLRSSLKQNNGRPTIVVWHKPRYTSGEHGNFTGSDKFWDVAVADRDVKLFLWGHDHNYERRIRTVSNRKFATFVVGNGGAELRNCNKPSSPPQLICGEQDNYGVLELTLDTSSFSWRYRKADGTSSGLIQDRGSLTWN